MHRRPEEYTTWEVRLTWECKLRLTSPSDKCLRINVLFSMNKQDKRLFFRTSTMNFAPWKFGVGLTAFSTGLRKRSYTPLQCYIIQSKLDHWITLAIFNMSFTYRTTHVLYGKAVQILLSSFGLMQRKESELSCRQIQNGRCPTKLLAVCFPAMLI